MSLSARTLLPGQPFQAADLGSLRCRCWAQGLQKGNCYQSGQFFWQLWSVLYQVGHDNYVFVVFVVCQFNCHRFIVVLKFLFFSLDHSAKDGNWCQRADFFLEETLTCIENKHTDLMSSDWLWSFVHCGCTISTWLPMGGHPEPRAVSLCVSTMKDELGLAWWITTSLGKEGHLKTWRSLFPLRPWLCFHIGESPPSRR